MTDVNIEFSMKKDNIKIGQYYMFDGYVYILASTGQNTAALIRLSDGNRWLNSIETANISFVTQNEFEKITGGKPFTHVPLLKLFVETADA